MASHFCGVPSQCTMVVALKMSRHNRGFTENVQCQSKFQESVLEFWKGNHPNCSSAPVLPPLLTKGFAGYLSVPNTIYANLLGLFPSVIKLSEMRASPLGSLHNHDLSLGI